MRKSTRDRIEALERDRHQHVEVPVNTEPKFHRANFDARKIRVRWSGEDPTNQWVVTVEKLGWPIFHWGLDPCWTAVDDFASQSHPTPLAAYKAGLKFVKAYKRRMADVELLAGMSGSQEFTKVIP